MPPRAEVTPAAPVWSYRWVREDVLSTSSMYHTNDAVRELSECVDVAHDAAADDYLIQRTQPGEPVCASYTLDDEPFMFVYEIMFVKFGVCLPFTEFECAILRSVNVPPSQLHANSWAFVRAFQIVCRALCVVLTVEEFFLLF